MTDREQLIQRMITVTERADLEAVLKEAEAYLDVHPDDNMLRLGLERVVMGLRA
jgi:hypothetical protein